MNDYMSDEEKQELVDCITRDTCSSIVNYFLSLISKSPFDAKDYIVKCDNIEFTFSPTDYFNTRYGNNIKPFVDSTSIMKHLENYREFKLNSKIVKISIKKPFDTYTVTIYNGIITGMIKYIAQSYGAINSDYYDPKYVFIYNINTQNKQEMKGFEEMTSKNDESIEETLNYSDIINAFKDKCELSLSALEKEASRVFEEICKSNTETDWRVGQPNSYKQKDKKSYLDNINKTCLFKEIKITIDPSLNSEEVCGIIKSKRLGDSFSIYYNGKLSKMLISMQVEKQDAEDIINLSLNGVCKIENYTQTLSSFFTISR